jgi:cell division protein FtsB
MSNPDASAAFAVDWRRLGRRALAVVLSLVIGALIVNALVGDQGLTAAMRARREYDGLAVDLERIRNDNARLRDQVRRLREDPSVIEEMARREFGLISPGERLFIIRDLPQPDTRLPIAPAR